MGDFMARTEEPIGAISGEDRHRAALHVASQALDATDARNLLDMLGLLDDLGEPADDAA